MEQAMRTKVFLLAIFALTLRAEAQTNPYWQWLGPPDSSEIDNIYASGDTIYAGTPNHLYATFDSGNSWAIIDSSLGSGQIVSMAVASNNPSIVYIGKGRGPGYIAGQLYETTDAGRTWKVVHAAPTDTSSFAVDHIYVSPFDSRILFGIIPVSVLYYDELFRSTDGGATWTSVGAFHAVDHGLKIELAFDPADSMKMYATGDDSYDFEFYASTDAGATWANRSYCNNVLIEFVTRDSVSNLLNYGDDDIYSSTDEGYTWNGPYNSYRNYFVLFLMRHVPRSPNIFYEVGYEVDSLSGTLQWAVYRSTDTTITWSQVQGSSELPLRNFYGYAFNGIHPPNDFEIDPSDDLIYIGTSKGVFKYYEPATGILAQNSTPQRFKLYQNYPNPFNPTTTISYVLPKSGRVVLTVYDILGRQVADLVNEEEPAGPHSLTFDASRFASGVYFYRITAPGVNAIKKMLLMK